ncbi:MAG: hypothetical protein IKX27_04060 [Oscillospiraceae bacterium]|nr:hypothetical protein [Oscillospiraceae bacterium]
MFVDKEFDNLWSPDGLWDRFNNGDYVLSEEERQILINHIDKFFDYIYEQEEVPLLDLALFNEFIFEMLQSGDDELTTIAYRALIRNSMLRNRLTEKQKEDSEEQK